MKNKSLLAIGLGIVCLLLLPSCRQPPREDQCMEYLIEQHLSDATGIDGFHVSYGNGDVEITIIERAGLLTSNSVGAIKRSKSLQNLRGSGDELLIDRLRKAENAIKSWPRVKSITWDALRPNEGISSAPSGYTEDDYRKGCAKYKP